MPYANGPSVRKLSKISTLLLAKNYILMLNKSLDEMKKLVSDVYKSQPPPSPALSSVAMATINHVNNATSCLSPSPVSHHSSVGKQQKQQQHEMMMSSNTVVTPPEAPLMPRLTPLLSNNSSIAKQQVSPSASRYSSSISGGSIGLKLTSPRNRSMNSEHSPNSSNSSQTSPTHQRMSALSPVKSHNLHHRLSPEGITGIQVLSTPHTHLPPLPHHPPHIPIPGPPTHPAALTPHHHHLPHHPNALIPLSFPPTIPQPSPLQHPHHNAFTLGNVYAHRLLYPY